LLYGTGEAARYLLVSPSTLTTEFFEHLKERTYDAMSLPGPVSHLGGAA
jgi:hypothetical protein